MTSPTHVLLVDDDDDVRETLQLILNDEGFEVTTAANGREALRVLRSEPRPAVVLLDLRMPEMDGWQTIDALRAEGLLGEVPIVICTSAPRDAPEGFPVLSKPIHLDELLTEISTVARRGG
jgi:two-component system, OmpR family, response regulator